jgi:transposase-like protein
MMHVIDAVLDSFADLFRSHRYPPIERLYSVFLFAVGLSLRDLSERLYLTGASRESVRMLVHRFPSSFRPSRMVRRLVAVDEAVLKVSGQTRYLWAEIDVDTKEVLAVYASRGEGFQALQQHKREDTEEPRRVGNRNCNNAQHHQTRRR